MLTILIKRGQEHMENPKVFISYSQDTKEHEEWVRQLATHLIDHGVDIILDQWDLRIGDDLLSFMESGLNSSKLVLCICSEEYVKKADDSRGGVGYEKNIIGYSLFKNSNANYVIPIIRNNSSKNLTPTFLNTKKYMDFRNDDDYQNNYNELINRIYDQDINKKPKLGKNPFEINSADKIYNKLNMESIKYNNPKDEGQVTFNYDNNSGIFTIGSGEKTFHTSWSKSGANSIYAYNDKVELIGYCENYRDYPTEEEIISDFNFSSRSRKVNIGDILIWINSKKHLAATKITSISNKDRGHSKTKVTFVYKIYKNFTEYNKKRLLNN